IGISDNATKTASKKMMIFFFMIGSFPKTAGDPDTGWLFGRKKSSPTIFGIIISYRFSEINRYCGYFFLFSIKKRPKEGTRETSFPAPCHRPAPETENGRFCPLQTPENMI
ncbi:MAG: hypothetical protein KBS76_05660, partial [Ruminococcus sp.]|nr:hypothetical protein [Candidatus Apopatosoma intestinale]